MDLSEAEHKLVIEQITLFEQSDQDTKNVGIRDALIDIFEPYMIPMRLLPKQIGILPTNRDGDPFTVNGVWLRGERVLNSAFSENARGKVWCFEDHPVKKEIEKYTMGVTSADPRFAQFKKGQIRVGPANWTHTNQFMCMIEDEAKCSLTTVPTRNGRLNKQEIMARDPKIKSYLSEGMDVSVFPFWVA